MIEQLVACYRANPTETQAEMGSQTLPPIDQGLDIMARMLEGRIPVARKKVLSCIGRITRETSRDDPYREGLLESLGSLEQYFLRRAYRDEIGTITFRLATTNQINLPRKAKLEARLRNFELLLENKPLENSRQRRREIEWKKRDQKWAQKVALQEVALRFRYPDR